MQLRYRYRYRRYPHPHQQAAPARAFGCARVVWNNALALHPCCSPSATWTKPSVNRVWIRGQRETAPALAWGLGKPDGERREGEREHTPL